MKTKRLLCGLLALLLCGALLAGCKQTAQNDTENTKTNDKGENVIMIEIEMQNGGVMKAELYPDIAPKTVANFVKLTKEGFYDGLIFHRVIPGFMIQGGDPQGTGYGGSKETVEGEFTANGVNNTLSHKRGVLSMARSQNYNSASSQFFICVADDDFLDGQYAAFGMVTGGMDVADAIAAVKRDGNDKPYEDQVIKTIRVVD